ncbi:MAG: SCP2 sterol-binding domain-containing protein [Rhodobacteraceae bacterium]|nr:SCP2 sterol-binding domain-containing protein [Paracoccaceae bacterium]
MSDILDTAVSALSAKIDGQSFDGSVKFELVDVGAVRIDENGVSVDDSDADCTLSADAEVFQAIIEGDTNPTSAFMTGKLKIDGDMSMALKLASLLA